MLNSAQRLRSTMPDELSMFRITPVAACYDFPVHCWSFGAEPPGGMDATVVFSSILMTSDAGHVLIDGALPSGRR